MYLGHYYVIITVQRHTFIYTTYLVSVSLLRSHEHVFYLVYRFLLSKWSVYIGYTYIYELYCILFILMLNWKIIIDIIFVQICFYK